GVEDGLFLDGVQPLEERGFGSHVPILRAGLTPPTRAVRHQRITTGVPMGRILRSLMMSSFSMRMQPWLEYCPIDDGLFVPCSPMIPPSSQFVRTSEYPDRV